jgi:hypothetical protein
MASAFVRLHVVDYEKWKAAFDGVQSTRQAASITGHSVHRDPDDPATVIIALRTSDLAATRAFAESDDLREIMRNAGVDAPPTFWFGDDVEEKTY